MKRWLLVVACSFLVAGCSGAVDGGGGGAGDSAPGDSASFTAPGMASAPEAGGVTRDQAPLAAERKEVVTGQIFMTVPDPVQASRDAVALVEDAGGRVDNRTENAETDYSPASGSLTARIPADDLTAAMDRISGLGEVTSTSVTRDDVTMQYQDLDARIAALQSSVDRLRTLMAQATDTADLIEAESALATRQGELDSLTSQREYLADQVELSTITVQFDTDDATPDPGPDNFLDGIVAGWHSLLDAAEAAFINLGRAIPWLGALATAAGIVYVAVRAVRRRPAQADSGTPAAADSAATGTDRTGTDRTGTDETGPDATAGGTGPPQQ